MLIAAGAIFVASPAFAQDDSEAAAPAGFGGPDAVANKMADDNLSLNEWRQNLKEDYGFSFSTGSAAIGLPNDAAVGVAYGSMLTDNIYVIAGITDTNGDPGKPFEGFDNFFSDNEYFTSVEIGWTSSHDRIIFDNTHLTFWHKDRQVEAGVNSGWGAAFSYSRYVNDKLMPFVRGAYADDGGTLLLKVSEPGSQLPDRSVFWPPGFGFQLGRAERRYVWSGTERPVRDRSVLPGACWRSLCGHGRHATHKRPGTEPGLKHTMDV